MRVVSVRSGSDSAFLCESGSVSGVRNAYFRKCGHRRRSVARSFGSPIEIFREWEGHHRSSITRIFGRITTRIFGSGSCRRGTQLVWAGSWRLPDDFCAPTTSGSSRSRQRRASKRRLIKLPLVFQGGFRCLQAADAALPSFGGGPPDHTLLAASMISIWSEATWTTSRTAGLSTRRTVEGLGWTESAPLAHDWVIDTRGRDRGFEQRCCSSSCAKRSNQQDRVAVRLDRSSMGEGQAGRPCDDQFCHSASHTKFDIRAKAGVTA